MVNSEILDFLTVICTTKVLVSEDVLLGRLSLDILFTRKCLSLYCILYFDILQLRLMLI